MQCVRAGKQARLHPAKVASTWKLPLQLQTVSWCPRLALQWGLAKRRGLPWLLPPRTLLVCAWSGQACLARGTHSLLMGQSDRITWQHGITCHE